MKYLTVKDIVDHLAESTDVVVWDEQTFDEYSPEECMDAKVIYFRAEGYGLIEITAKVTKP